MRHIAAVDESVKTLQAYFKGLIIWEFNTH